MAEVDRLGWTAGVAFTAYGTSVGIRTNDESALDRIPALLPPVWKPFRGPIVDALFSLRIGPPSTRKGQRNFHLLYSGATRQARTLDLDEVFNLLENQIHSSVAYWAREDHLFVHAGVVGWRGRAILLPGGTRAGKTTLVSELIRAGAIYYSDDMALLDSKGRVFPYNVPLSVRESGGPRKYAPEAFGSSAGKGPLPVGLVVMTQFQEDARWQPRALSPSRALIALLQNTIAARKDPKVSLPILRRVVARAAVLKTMRGEAADVVGRLLAALPAKGPRVAASANR